MANPVQGMPPLPRKNTSPLVWILVAVGGFVVLAGIVLIAGGLFVAKKVHDAAGNPALAAARLMAAATSDVEVLSSDDSKGTVTFKEKKTGKVYTLDFDQLKDGKFHLEEDGNKVAVDGSGEGLDIRGPDGSTVRIGTRSSAKMPAWLPAYPGSDAQGTFAMQGGNESGAAVSLTTRDSIDKVSKFYQDAFKAAGLTTNVNLMDQEGKTIGGMIAGESVDKKKSAVVNMASVDDAVTVTITYSDKK